MLIWGLFMNKRAQSKGMKFKNFDAKKTIFCNVTWMQRYQDISEQDPIHAGGASVKENKDAEKYNFDDWGDGYFYGYFPFKLNMNIKELGALKNATEVSGITVIWTAKHPRGGKRVVGWYKNATVFREMQVVEDGCPYRVYAEMKNCRLVPVDERLLKVPYGKGRPMRALSYGKNLCDSDKENKSLLAGLDGLMSGTPQSRPPKNQKKLNGGSGKNIDVEKRMVVEKTAVDCVTTYYENIGWESKSVEGDNVGWDLTMTWGNDELHVEVKGHQGNKITSELTPNEYANAKSKKHAYRLAVVTKALTKTPCLRIFEPTIYKNAKNLQWDCIFGNNTVLSTKEIVGARIVEK